MSSRLILLLLLGFASGLPLGLTGSVLQAWMTDEHLALSTISVFALVGVPYSLKFLWAPLMDRFVPPGFARFGRRRGWLLLTQLALMVAILTLGLSHPREHLGATALLAVLTAFFSASQDIVFDAYKTDILPADELGPGAAVSTTGYRIAMIVSTSVALILSDHLPWSAVYALMALAMLIGVAATLMAPEPPGAAGAPRTLGAAVVQPFVEFFRRRGSVEVILFTLLYKLDAVMTVALTTPFVMGLGFSKTDIGAVTKGFGLGATLAGTLVGGALMVRLGLKRSLWIFGFSQALAGISFWALSQAGHSYPWLIAAVAAENACSGMGNSAYAAFLMSQCDRRFSATQYALLSSLMAVTRSVLSAPAGFLAMSLGWSGYYVFCIFASAPAFLLLLRYDRWQSHLADPN